jgi:hypothetical protein
MARNTNQHCLLLLETSSSKHKHILNKHKHKLSLLYLQYLATMAAQDNQNAAAADADTEAAEAAAEVAAMTGVNPARQRASGGGTRQQRDPTADQAVMGAAQEGSFEVLDETGERVRARFLQFLLE